MLEGEVVTKVFGIPLRTICQVFSNTVNEQDMSDPESVDSVMINSSITEMNDRLIEHKQNKNKLTRKVLHSQQLISATERALSKRTRVESDTIAEAAVVVTEIDAEQVTGANPEPIVTEQEEVDYGQPNDVPEVNTLEWLAPTPPPAVTEDVTAEPVPPPMPMSCEDFGKGLVCIAEELELSCETEELSGSGSDGSAKIVTISAATRAKLCMRVNELLELSSCVQFKLVADDIDKYAYVVKSIVNAQIDSATAILFVTHILGIWSQQVQCDEWKPYLAELKHVNKELVAWMLAARQNLPTPVPVTSSVVDTAVK